MHLLTAKSTPCAKNSATIISFINFKTDAIIGCKTPFNVGKPIAIHVPVIKNEAKTKTIPATCCNDIFGKEYNENTSFQLSKT